MLIKNKQHQTLNIYIYIYILRNPGCCFFFSRQIWIPTAGVNIVQLPGHRMSIQVHKVKEER